MIADNGVIHKEFSNIQWKQFGELWSTNEKKSTLSYDLEIK